MVSSTRQAIACIFVIIGIAAQAQAQNTPAKDQTASISGKVTLKGKAVAGIVVVLTEDKYNSGGWRRSRYRGTTDLEGNYRITNIPAGNYYAFPLAPAFVPEKAQAKQSIVVGAGETLRDVDFALVRGGVITGKITDSEEQPVINEHVMVMPMEPFETDMPSQLNTLETDDRGIYRAFGLRPGKYKISVGHSDTGLPDGAGRSYKQTFYPSVTDREKATVIEVKEGGEIGDIDIVVSQPTSAATVTGRVIDGETGLPVTSFGLGVYQKNGNGSSSSSTGERFNKDGQFKLENVRPGRYTVFIVPPAKSEWRADPVTFDVSDKDLTGLEIKTKRGASISGVLVLEGNSTTAKLTDIHIFPMLQSRSSQFSGGMQSTPVNPDGSFKIGGLEAGTVRFALGGSSPFPTSAFEILGIEHNGVFQAEGISVKDGEFVTGVRVLVKSINLTGSIRGQVKAESGELDPSIRFSISISAIAENQSKSPTRSWSNAPEVDARGRFLIAHLAAGTYELRLMMYQPERRALDEIIKQEVTVSENTATEVTLVVKTKQQ